ncbi:type I-E CRISPR-associated protein Cse1/CasA [Actinosynnema sp. ALI-1.44]|nr:type I-E CRISPR-associated protein Cse1/CasA [Actinosynnema sp. ALI-1.44]
MPFAPASTSNGRRSHSLTSLFDNAGQIKDISVSFPTLAPALLRQLLVPIVLDALGPPGSPAEWKERFTLGVFGRDDIKKIHAYLNEYHDRFDLFDEVRPFAQTAGLQSQTGTTKSISLLLPHQASGNNVPLFSNRTEGDKITLTPAEAALWLLHTHCWDTAAIKTGAVGDPLATAGKTMGNPVGPLGRLGVVIPAGRNLFETIMLNLPVLEDGDEGLGTPQWRHPEPSTARWRSRQAAGLLDLLTWQSRRIRLFPERIDGTLVVSQVMIAAGDRLADIPDYEPHTTWRIEPATKSSPATRKPKRHTAGKAAWRGLDSLLALRGIDRAPGPSAETSSLLTQIGELRVDGALPADFPLQAHIYGLIYGQKMAVFEDSVSDALPLPVSALTTTDPTRDAILEVAEQAENLAWALNRLADDLRRAQGSDQAPRDKGQRPGDIAIHGFDRWVRRFLAGLQRAGADENQIEAGRLAWETAARRVVLSIAESVLEASPQIVFRGHVDVDQRTDKKTIYRESTAEKAFRARVRKTLARLGRGDTTKEGS